MKCRNPRIRLFWPNVYGLGLSDILLYTNTTACVCTKIVIAFDTFFLILVKLLIA